MLADDPEADFDDEEGGFHKQLKTKFIDGNAGFMSLVALALVLGLAFCIERIIYLTLSEIKARKLMEDIEQHLKNDDVEGAKTLCRNTRGPVASVCYQGLLHIDQPIEAIERSITNYGGLQATNLVRSLTPLISAGLWKMSVASLSVMEMFSPPRAATCALTGSRRKL